MAFEHVRFRFVASCYVSFYSQHILFPQRVVREFGLADDKFVELGIDADRHRLYFRFSTHPTPAALPFSCRSEKSEDRVIPARRLYDRYKWLGAVRTVKEPARKKYRLRDVDNTVDGAPDGFDTCIDIVVGPFRGLRFSPKNLPRKAGIYWLLNEYGDVLRIGESENLQAVMYTQWQQYGAELKSFDYEIVTNARTRLAKCNEYIKTYETDRGRLPDYNPLLLSKKRGPTNK